MIKGYFLPRPIERFNPYLLAPKKGEGNRNCPRVTTFVTIQN